MSRSSRSTDSDDDDADVATLDRLRLSRPRPPPPPPPLCALRAHGGDVQAAALSPCGSLLYTGDSEGDLRVWDVEDRRTASVLRLHPSEGGVLGLRLCSSGRELLSQGREGTLKLWKLSESGREVVDGADSEGFCVLSAVEAEGGTILAAVASEDAASVRVFDARRGELVCELGEAEAAAAVSATRRGSVTESGGAVAAASRREEAGQQQPKSRGMAMAVTLFFFPRSFPDATLHSLVGYEDGSVVLWRCLDCEGGKGEGSKSGVNGGGSALGTAASSPRALASLRIHFDAITAIAMTHPEASVSGGPLRFLSAGADSVLASYLVEADSSSSSSSLCLRPGPAAKLPARGVGALAVLSKGKRGGAGGEGEGEGTLVAAGGWDGTIRLLALQASGNEDGESDENDEENPLPSSSSSPPPLSLEPVGELEHHVAPIAALAFGASGGLLASGGRDGSVALWDLRRALL